MASVAVMHSPFDIMLRLPSSALNSISCDLATEPDASMFCTAKTKSTTLVSTPERPKPVVDTYAQC